MSLTAAVFINERKQGLLDRSLVAGKYDEIILYPHLIYITNFAFIGVRTSEILLAHLVTQFTVLVFQSSVVLLVMLLVFKITCQGSLVLAMFITLLQGLCGMFYGKFICFAYTLYLFSLMKMIEKFRFRGFESLRPTN